MVFWHCRSVFGSSERVVQLSELQHNTPLRNVVVSKIKQSALVLIALTLGIGPSVSQAETSEDGGDGPSLFRREQIFDDLEGVGIEEHLSDKLPLHLRFTDSTGQWQSLQELFRGDRPVVLTLNYSSCPLLCGTQLQGLVEALRKIDATVGKDFDVIRLSIDPLEGPEIAADSKKHYVGLYGRPGAAKGWHFLTGQRPDIRKLAAAVGFQYKYIRATGEYAHTTALILCTPDGRISRYIYGKSGVEYNPTTLRLSLVEAGEGKIGTSLDQVLLFCYQWDPDRGDYSLVAVQVMRIAGGLTVIVLLAVLVPAWMFSRRGTINMTKGTGPDSPGSGPGDYGGDGPEDDPDGDQPPPSEPSRRTRQDEPISILH